jgi:hypothetical protein
VLRGAALANLVEDLHDGSTLSSVRRSRGLTGRLPRWCAIVAFLVLAGACDDADEVVAPDDPPAGPAVVRAVLPETVQVGDSLLVEVRIEDAVNVGSVPFHLRYPEDLVQFLPPATEGAFLGNDGTETIFLAADVGDGEIVVGASRLGGHSGASGSGILATFTFRASAAGTAPFAFTAASVKDPEAKNLPASFVPASMRIDPP